MMAAEANQTAEVLGKISLRLRNMSDPDSLIAGE
jgi:hypothetical protein